MKVVKRSSLENRYKKRTIIHTQGSWNVRTAIGPIYTQMEGYGILAGQFHFINIIEYLVGQIEAYKEPMTLDISSWTIAKFEASRLATISQSDYISRLRIIVDSSMLNLVPDSFDFLRGLVADDSIRLLRCHCKFALISSKTWNIAIRTSMNLNQNKRLENFEISDCIDLVSYMTGIVDDIFSVPFDPKGKVKINELGGDKNAPKFTNDLLIDISDFD